MYFVYVVNVTWAMSVKAHFLEFGRLIKKVLECLTVLTPELLISSNTVSKKKIESLPQNTTTILRESLQ